MNGLSEDWAESERKAYALLRSAFYTAGDDSGGADITAVADSAVLDGDAGDVLFILAVKAATLLDFVLATRQRAGQSSDPEEILGMI